MTVKKLINSYYRICFQVIQYSDIIHPKITFELKKEGINKSLASKGEQVSPNFSIIIYVILEVKPSADPLGLN